MKLKLFLLLTGAVLSFGSASAQYAEDALRFSYQNQGATARFRALGNAQTSLGGDLSSLSSNPAGLGLFTRNEVNFTADFTNSSVSSLYGQNATTSARENKLGFNQVGAVFHVPAVTYRGKSSKWKAFNIGVGYNKTNNYNSDVAYGGPNTRSSFADYLADLSDGYLSAGNPGVNADVLPQGSLERMAYDNFLTEYDAAGYFPTTAVSSVLGNEQQNSVFFTGSQSELNLAGGANYNNQLYIGASISFSSLNFGADRTFTESGRTRTYTGQPADLIGARYTLAYRSNQVTDGSGVNAKLGLIYHATPFVRVGVNFISPTWYSIDDSFSEALDTRYVRANGTAIPEYTNTEELYESSYNLRTPYKITIGGSLISPKIGLLSADVEYVDYSTIHFSSDDRITADNINRDIRNTYQSAVNARLGGELRVNPLLMLRGGANIQGNPYSDREYTSRVLSGGIGYRKNNFYTDLTYANAYTKYTARPYAISAGYSDYAFTGPGEQAGITDRRDNFYLTFGVRF